MASPHCTHTSPHCTSSLHLFTLLTCDMLMSEPMLPATTVTWEVRVRGSRVRMGIEGENEDEPLLPTIRITLK